MSFIKTYEDLQTFQNAKRLANDLFEISKHFPKEEKYSLVDQMRRSSRSVCANLAEAWSKRRYQAAFIAKLSDAETEAHETRVWVDFAYQCNYIDQTMAEKLNQDYRHVISQIIQMINTSHKWLLP